jgi:hypothetical protein
VTTFSAAVMGLLAVAALTHALVSSVRRRRRRDLADAAGTSVAAILVAAGPGWVASRIPPATVLQSE